MTNVVSVIHLYSGITIVQLFISLLTMVSCYLDQPAGQVIIVSVHFSKTIDISTLHTLN